MIEALIEYAEGHYTLKKTVKTGGTSRDHLIQRARNERKPLDYYLEKESPQEPPRELAFTWDVFLELEQATDDGFSRPQPIPISEIAAWQNLYGIQLEPWQIRTIRRLDTTRRNVITEQNGRDRRTGASNSKPGSHSGARAPRTAR